MLLFFLRINGLKKQMQLVLFQSLAVAVALMLTKILLLNLLLGYLQNSNCILLKNFKDLKKKKMNVWHLVGMQSEY